MDYANVAERNGLTSEIAYFAENTQCLVTIVDRFLLLSDRAVGYGDAVKDNPFDPPQADDLRRTERLIVVCERLLSFASQGVDLPDVMQSQRLSHAIARLAADG